MRRSVSCETDPRQLRKHPRKTRGFDRSRIWRRFPNIASMKSIDVAAGLVFRQGRLLLTQRPTGGHLAGLWEFPGGKREPLESFEECLRRGVIEELGLEVGGAGFG